KPKYAELLIIDHEPLKPLVAQVVDVGVITGKEDERPQHVDMLLHPGPMLGAYLSNELLGAVDKGRRPLLWDVLRLANAAAEPFDHSLKPMIDLPAPIAQGLLQRAKVTQGDRLPEVANVRHVCQDKVQATLQCLPANDTEEVRLAGACWAQQG